MKMNVLSALGAGVLLFAAANPAAAAYKQCAASDTDTQCWRQITFTNFKDFAVGNNMMCMVGGNVQPATNTDAYIHPNAHTDNQGNEDMVECHRPSGHSGFESHPVYLGTGTNRDAQTRVPGGVYDDGNWGGIPTGVIALWGNPGDDVAVLNSQQYLYISTGDSSNPWSGSTQYTPFTLDRMNIDATTGATICLKGIYSQVGPGTSFYELYGFGCDGTVYVRRTFNYVGWDQHSPTVYKDVGGGWGYFYGLMTDDTIYRRSFTSKTLPALPSGLPLYIGDRYVISNTGNSIYEWSSDTSSWMFRDVSYPESADPTSSLRQIDSGQRFRGISGEFFVSQSFGRIYSFTP